MSLLCGCRRREGPPISLDAEIQVPGDCSVAIDDLPPNRRILGYPLFGARRCNFDFVTKDNGESFVATFRALYRGETMGHDSKPIPKEIFNNVRVIKQKKSGDVYIILLDTGGHDLIPFVVEEFTKEELEMLGIKEY